MVDDVQRDMLDEPLSGILTYRNSPLSCFMARLPLLQLFDRVSLLVVVDDLVMHAAEQDEVPKTMPLLAVLRGAVSSRPWLVTSDVADFSKDRAAGRVHQRARAAREGALVPRHRKEPLHGGR